MWRVYSCKRRHSSFAIWTRAQWLLPGSEKARGKSSSESARCGKVQSTRQRPSRPALGYLAVLKNYQCATAEDRRPIFPRRNFVRTPRETYTGFRNRKHYLNVNDRPNYSHLNGTPLWYLLIHLSLWGSINNAIVRVFCHLFTPDLLRVKLCLCEFWYKYAIVMKKKTIMTRRALI